MKPKPLSTSTRFQPGQSGNPAGRPKAHGDMRELARQHGPEALMKLVEIMRGEDLKAAVSAADKILDRGFGRPVTPIGGDGESGPISISICWQGDGEAA